MGRRLQSHLCSRLREEVALPVTYPSRDRKGDGCLSVMMRRLSPVAPAFLFALLLVGCNREHKKVIAVIPKGNADIFWQSVHAGAVKAGRETGVEILWNGPANESDYTSQLQIVEAMINKHVDAIALAPSDRQAMVRVVERAANEKVPMIIFDSGVDTE